MLSYRHAFHAGNHADLLKHGVLACLLDYLKRKDKPFSYIDTHAGGGVYDLQGEWSRKVAEYRDGIGRLWPQRSQFPELASYFRAIAALNEPTAEKSPVPRYYPGSPMVALQLTRDQDRLMLAELHNAEVEVLRQNFKGNDRVAVHHRDGFEALTALCPPMPRRGLVLIDPPYELKQDYQAVLTTLAKALKRWPQGCYAIWYPILGRAVDRSDQLLRGAARLSADSMLQIELRVMRDQQERGMHGSGMLVLNPPWQFDATVRAFLPRLTELLAQDDQAGYTLEWLKVAE